MIQIVTRKQPPEVRAAISIKVRRFIVQQFEVEWKDVLGRSRHRPLPEARQVYYYLMLQYTKTSLTALAEETNRHHSTVIHGHRRIADLVSIQDEFITYIINAFTKRAKRLKV